MAAIIKINQLNDLLFEAKKLLHGQVALREALKAALKEVAPGHPLNDSDTRQKIVEEAMVKRRAICILRLESRNSSVQTA